MTPAPDDVNARVQIGMDELRALAQEAQEAAAGAERRMRLDAFAAAALTGIIAQRTPDDPWSPSAVAHDAWTYAKAMLTADPERAS